MPRHEGWAAVSAARSRVPPLKEADAIELLHSRRECASTSPYSVACCVTTAADRHPGVPAAGRKLRLTPCSHASLLLVLILCLRRLTSGCTSCGTRASSASPSRSGRLLLCSPLAPRPLHHVLCTCCVCTFALDARVPRQPALQRGPARISPVACTRYYLPAANAPTWCCAQPEALQ